MFAGSQPNWQLQLWGRGYHIGVFWMWLYWLSVLDKITCSSVQAVQGCVCWCLQNRMVTPYSPLLRVNWWREHWQSSLWLWWRPCPSTQLKGTTHLLCGGTEEWWKSALHTTCSSCFPGQIHVVASQPFFFVVVVKYCEILTTMFYIFSALKQYMVLLYCFTVWW